MTIADGSMLYDIAMNTVESLAKDCGVHLSNDQRQAWSRRLSGAVSLAFADEVKAIRRDMQPEPPFVLRNKDGQYLDRYGASTWAVAGADVFDEAGARVACGALPVEEGWEAIPRPIY